MTVLNTKWYVEIKVQYLKEQGRPRAVKFTQTEKRWCLWGRSGRVLLTGTGRQLRKMESSGDDDCDGWMTMQVYSVPLTCSLVSVTVTNFIYVFFSQFGRKT